MCVLYDICDSHLFPASLLIAVSLRNVAEILEFCSTYNAAQLRWSCLQFVCVNLPALLEARLLDTLSLPLLEELSQTYHKMVRGVLQCIHLQHTIKCLT